jgi:hypothetical protein
MREIGLDPDDRACARPSELIEEIIGFPRHLSQHVGGFVITEGRLDELVPIENATMEDRTVICWDKDDIDALGILKVDVLALGMLTCIRKAFDLIADAPPGRLHARHAAARGPGGLRHAVQGRQPRRLPGRKPGADELPAAHAPALFLRPRDPGRDHPPRPDPGRHGAPLSSAPQRGGGGELPLRRAGPVLGKTLGVPLFQEQAMQIAITGAGFTPEEADRLRRALATFKKHGNVSEFRTASCAGMRANGYDEISPSAAFPRSRASAPTASPKATRPASRCWSMPRPGSSATTPASSPARC